MPGGSETILLVEDDEMVRDMVARILTDKGYRVFTAPDGKAGLATYQEHSGEIHLLLTDMILPKLSGRELARRLREHNPRLKVLYMSGYTEKAVVEPGGLPGGAAFMAKPFSVPDLLARVRQVLDG
jgi:DNA-binding response OmpR family regulator